MDLKDLKRLFENAHTEVENLWRALWHRYNKTEDPAFWNDRKTADNIISDITNKKNTINSIESIKKELEENIELLGLLEQEDDTDLKSQLEDYANVLQSKLEKLSLSLLLNGPFDKNDCIIDIHSGAGGTEACDWAEMLYRMYSRWCEKKGYKTKLLDYQAGEEAGIKSVSLKVIGTNAYGYLKNEKGVHRLVRLSPFDSNNRRHTSFASVEVTPEIDQDNNIEIDEKDLRIDVYRSSGCGGQGVNTTDSAVRITYLLK